MTNFYPPLSPTVNLKLLIYFKKIYYNKKGTKTEYTGS